MTQATATKAPQSSLTPIPAQAPPVIARTVCGIEGVTDAAAQYTALQAQRRVLTQELDRLGDARLSVAQRLRQGGAADGADVQGLQKRLESLNASIATVEGQLAGNAEKLACFAAVPGAVQPPPPPPPRTGPDDELAIAGLFFSAMLALPLVIAWSRRIWRRGVQSVPYVPPELNERLMRIEQSVESVAIEVERVGEGQRFVTNLFAQNGSRALGGGAMEPVDVQHRERVAQERRDR